MMNHFPTRVLAIDGSEEAELALQTAVSLARSTGSEMHVVHGEHVDEGIPNPAEVLKRDVERTEQQAQHFLDRQVQRIGTRAWSLGNLVLGGDGPPTR